MIASLKRIILNILKIVFTYFVFGFVIVLVISFSGRRESLLITQTMGPMAFADYVMLCGYVELFWLPFMIGVIVSQNNYFAFNGYKLLFTAVLVLFGVVIYRLIKREKK